MAKNVRETESEKWKRLARETELEKWKRLDVSDKELVKNWTEIQIGLSNEQRAVAMKRVSRQETLDYLILSAGYRWWDCDNDKPMAPYALSAWILQQANQEDGLWKMATALMDTSNLAFTPTRYWLDFRKRVRPREFKFVETLEYDAFVRLPIKKRLYFSLKGITNFILDDINPFCKSLTNQKLLAEELTGIKPAAKTLTPLRNCLNRYFEPSLEQLSVTAIQLACQVLALKWRAYAWRHDPNFMVNLFTALSDPQQEWLMALRTDEEIKVQEDEVVKMLEEERKRRQAYAVEWGNRQYERTGGMRIWTLDKDEYVFH